MEGPLTPEKLECPAPTLIYLGIIIDTAMGELWLVPEMLQCLLDDVMVWIDKRVCTITSDAWLWGMVQKTNEKTNGSNSHGQMTSWARTLPSRSSFLWSLLPWYGDHFLLENVSFLTATIILLSSQSSCNSRYSKDKDLTQLLWCLFFIEASFHIQLIAHHRPGTLNDCADDFLHNHLSSFQAKLTQAVSYPTSIATSLLQWLLQPQWTISLSIGSGSLLLLWERSSWVYSQHIPISLKEVCHFLFTIYLIVSPFPVF